MPLFRTKPLAEQSEMALEDGSRVAVMGGGPAGSFFSYFLLDMAQRVGINLHLDIYEPRNFSVPGPAGCNMCGGIISESLVQNLAIEGINLPPAVVKRGIDSYMLHMDVGDVRIETPLHEMRIGAVHRGAGPKGIKDNVWRSFDGYLLELAANKGAHLIPRRVDGISLHEGRPQLKAGDLSPEPYDLLVAAVGVNTAALKLFEGVAGNYKPPKSTKTYISELYLGEELVEKLMGSSMHVFLLNIPRLEFAALIPKGNYVTLCLLGDEIDGALVKAFLDAPEVKKCLPPDYQVAADACHCSPRISVMGAEQPYADRMVFIGDCGTARLYKDGIGSAYRTAKAAAITAMFDGISATDFRKHYAPACQAIENDNRYGKVTFLVTRQIQKRQFLRRGVFRMISASQHKEGSRRLMSRVMWDMFTGSAPYKDVFKRTLMPTFIGRLMWNTGRGIIPLKRDKH